jgi:hypothetical protein
MHGTLGIAQFRDTNKPPFFALMRKNVLAVVATSVLFAAPLAFADEYEQQQETTLDYPAYQAPCRCCPRCGRYQGRPARCPNCSPHVAPGAANEPGAMESERTPGPSDQTSPGAQTSPGNQTSPSQTDSLASSFGAASAPQSAAPFMIGDSFGGGGGQFVFTFSDSGVSKFAIPAGGGGGPMKIADNSSPLPRCRAFVNYNYFSHAVQSSISDVNGITTSSQNLNVNRYTFGWEQCFADGLFSVELRVPFASTIGSDQTAFQDATQATQFGHVTGTLKAILYQTETWALTGGLALNTPSSNNFRVFNPLTTNPTLLAQVNDQSIHLQPFLGYISTPNSRLFVQAFAQFDFDTRGNDVLLNNGTNLQRAGIVQDQSLLFLDASIGYWAFRDSNKNRGITGIAPMIELHYTTTLQNADTLNVPDLGVTYGNTFNRIDVLNLTSGVSVFFGQRTFITLAGTSPMAAFPNRFFNGEATVLYNYLF